MALETRIYTAADLLAMPDDGWRYELVHGELRKAPYATAREGAIAANLMGHLGQYLATHDLGTGYAGGTGFRLASDPDTVRAPDLAFVRRERLVAVTDGDDFWPGAPDLAVEVIAPTDTYSAVLEKAFEWLDAGTQMVVVIDPEKRTVTVYHSRAAIRVLTEADTLEGGAVLPGWALPVRELFAS